MLDAWLFYKYDNIFKQPKGYIKLTITQPKLEDNLTNLAAYFIMRCFDHYVKNEIDAGKAGLRWGIWCTQPNINLNVNGWNDKLPTLLEELLKYLTMF